MRRENLNDLQAFVHVAREGSFTRAAAQLGVSQSALSHTLRALEQRLGVRLLTRTTRSVSTTEAGQRLLETLSPRLAEIEDELAALAEYRDRPAGTIRISAAGHAAEHVVWPRLERVLQQYPDLKVELTVDYGLADIVAQRHDIGIRLGDQVARDMIAVPISPPLRMCVVGSPAYFRHHVIPTHPQQLAAHNCINLRLPTHGGLMPWEFARDGEELNLRVSGQWTFNNSGLMLRAALAEGGLAWLPCDLAQQAVDAGRLLSVLEDWCPEFEGYYAYYPSRRQASVALRIILDALRGARHPD
ncbi:LysR family transcriptional regulator [Stenotrophomonas sp. CFBP8980]|uniref:LysR family transcriptional regulator n=1 Tax=Stenotrophomonas sp. CFBP8980 TaxID=3096523 RepID=UPI0005AF143C|nr:LysR family transcriptional regulator [Stenotrophomonas sp. CFBP8980]KIP86558.1 LysR family transcriptional regulator [Stenotrophomonas maltophilia]MDY1033446.1 LysR family transcriptional regulator [Stenotrophomonas sp. CFBP8980]